MTSAELRAVLVFHSIVDFQWHPTVRELLLISHPDEAYRGPLFLWDSLPDGPKVVSLQDQLSNRKLISKTRGTWLNSNNDAPTLLLSDNGQYCLVSFSKDDAPGPPWQDSSDYSITASVDESLTRIQPWDDREDDTSLLDDTFSFKRV